MTGTAPSQALSRSIDEALEMLRADDDWSEAVPLPAESLLSLLEQCEIACATMRPAPQMRTLHHFACTGGSLMSKALFALPNVILLSEIDPLSPLKVSEHGKAPFAPTDLISTLRHSIRPVSDSTLISVFLEGLVAAEAGVGREGRTLVLRDHAHSQFCLRTVEFESRPTLREMVMDRFEVLSLVTMRHPLDSFLSMTQRAWVHFDPGTLEEYARRYLAFLDRHDGVPVVLYEDFVSDPEATLKRMCGHLDLPFSPLAVDLIGVIRVSGDSGRGDERIGPRPRRAVPSDIEGQRGDSAAYHDLCARFGYEP